LESEIDTVLIPSVFLQAIDVEAIKRLDQRGVSRYIKRRWIKRGYTQQLSLYAVVKNLDTEENHYRRVEILSNTPFTCPIVMYVYEFFEKSLPPYAYSIWLYNKERMALGMVAKYEQRRK